MCVRLQQQQIRINFEPKIRNSRIRGVKISGDESRVAPDVGGLILHKVLVLRSSLWLEVLPCLWLVLRLKVENLQTYIEEALLRTQKMSWELFFPQLNESFNVGRIGIGICHDIRFPELAMLYRAKGADLIIYPGAFNMSTGKMLWELETKARCLLLFVHHAEIQLDLTKFGVIP